MRRLARPDALHATLLVGLALLLAAIYWIAVDFKDMALSQQMHGWILRGEAGSPYRYRVLVPFLVDPLVRLLSRTGLGVLGLPVAYIVYDSLALTFQLLALYWLFRHWFRPSRALVGVLFTAAVEIITFGYFVYQPWSLLEVGWFALGLGLACERRPVALGVVVVLAALTRETGVFLPLAILLESLGSLRRFSLVERLKDPWQRLALGYLLLSVAIFAALRLLRGSVTQVDELTMVIQRNLQPNNLRSAGLVLSLMLGVGWLFAPLGLRRAPGFLVRASRVIPLYLAAFVIWGWWREGRILTTLYPFVVPLILAFIYPLDGNARVDERSATAKRRESRDSHD